MLHWILTNTPLAYLTQSVWRDEAFSLLVAQRPLSWIIANSSFEPPVYYTLLHYWLKLFGTSEIAARSLSFLGFILATIVIIYWSEKLFHKSWVAIIIPILFFLNPMLLYYAFEIRTYGWYIFFATLSMYAYTQKWWRLYILATVLGFYTHSYFLIVPAAQVLHWFFSKKFERKRVAEPFFIAALISGACILPWALRLSTLATKLKESWYFPVDFHLIRSVIGNMYLGYEGTPWYLWEYTTALSVVLLILFLFAIRNTKKNSIPFYLFLTIFAPLVAVIGVSFIKPLFVNRYLIPVTIAQVVLLGYTLTTIQNKNTQRLLGLGLIVGSIIFNLWYPNKHQKVDIRKTLFEVNTLLGEQDIVLARSPLVLFESIYYAKDPSRVYLYNPSGAPFPWYVGDTLYDTSKAVSDLPPYPSQAFIIAEDGSYMVMYRTKPLGLFR